MLFHQRVSSTFVTNDAKLRLDFFAALETGLLGFFATKAAGFNERTCRTVAIETAMKLSKGWFEGLNGVKCHGSMFGNG